MDKSDSNESDLIASLYDAALEPDKWNLALDNLSRSVGGIAGHVILWHEATQTTPFFADIGVEKKAFEDYAQYWGAHDPRRQWLMENPPGQWVGCHRICDEREVGRSPFYQEYCIPWNVRHVMVARLGDTPELSAMMAIGRAPGMPAFEAHHERALNRHNRHLYNAFRVQLRLSEAAARVRVLEGLADHVADPLLILKPDGRLHFANAAAESLLARPDTSVVLRNGRIEARSAGSSSRLRALVRTAATTGEGGALRIPRTGPVFAGNGVHGALNVVVCPLSERLRIMHAASEPLALVMISDEADSVHVAPAVLRALFGFTPAETRLALALMAGDSPDEYAASRQLKITTVRTQIVALKDKTGVRRISDLVRMLLKVPVPHDHSKS